MGNTIVDNAYYDWLLTVIEYIPGDYVYDEVFDLMFNTPFRWSVPNDDNRAGDGIELRYDFMEYEGWNTMPLEGEPCNVLEMLIALAQRIENDIMWDGEHDRTAKWFWEMVRNLGFWSEKVGNRANYKEIIDCWLDRKPRKSGQVTTFPTKKWAKTDQKNIEIWYQAQAYLMENYKI